MRFDKRNKGGFMAQTSIPFNKDMAKNFKAGFSTLHDSYQRKLKNGKEDDGDIRFMSLSDEFIYEAYTTSEVEQFLEEDMEYIESGYDELDFEKEYRSERNMEQLRNRWRKKIEP